MGEKVNPFIEIPQVQLYPGEVIIPLNPYTNEGYIIKPYYYVTNFGRFFSIATGRLEEKMIRVLDGYGDVQVMTDHGQKHLSIHRAIMASFCPVPNMYELQVDHIFGNTMDNRLWMLRWATSQLNNISAYEQGITKPRKRIISDDIIIKIIDMANQGISDKDISEELSKEIKIAPETVRFVRTGKEIYGEVLENLGLKPVFRKEHTYLTKKDYEKIAELFADGKDAAYIANELGLAVRTVRAIIFKLYGNASERDYLVRKDLNTEQVPTKKDPFVTIPQKYIDQGIEITPINIHVSNKYTIKPWYGVTKDGRVFSMGRGNQWVEMTLRCDERTKGYKTVGLTTDKGTKQFRVHRLVLATFDPRPDMYDLEIDHKFGDKDDNNLHHLKWVTHEENMKNAARNGLTQHRCLGAPDEDVIKINELAWLGKSDAEIYELMEKKYSMKTVRVIRSGLKTYGKRLEILGLAPYKYHRPNITPEEKEAIYNYIYDMRENQPVMELYKYAAEKFGASPDTIREIYRLERDKRNN